jgi:hypothetical protein
VQRSASRPRPAPAASPRAPREIIGIDQPGVDPVAGLRKAQAIGIADKPPGRMQPTQEDRSPPSDPRVTAAWRSSATREEPRVHVLQPKAEAAFLDQAGERAMLEVERGRSAPISPELHPEEIALVPARSLRVSPERHAEIALASALPRSQGSGVADMLELRRRVPVDRQVDLVRGLVVMVVEEQLLRRRALAAGAGVDRDRGMPDWTKL